MTPGGSARPAAPDTPVRRLLLALVVFGALGLGAELVLLEHWEQATQWAPFVALTATVVTASGLWLRPSGRAVRVFRWTMWIVTVVGLVGVTLHLRSNVAFEREIVPDAAGAGLLLEALRGATPTLAPGALLQLGLLGLIVTFRHPLLRNGDPPARGSHSDTETD